jgi:hypothetical protein
MSLKVFDLQCEHGHLFEGWFGSHDDYDNQQARGLLTCPVCHSAHIQKMLSAPRLNLAHPMGSGPAVVPHTGADLTTQHDSHQPPRHSSYPARLPDSAQENSSRQFATKADFQSAMTTPEMMKIQAQMMMRMREMVLATENVGVRFAEEARAIHEGDSPERAIRGVTTPDERQALAEDGIMVVAIPDFLDTSKLQ